MKAAAQRSPHSRLKRLIATIVAIGCLSLAAFFVLSDDDEDMIEPTELSSIASDSALSERLAIWSEFIPYRDLESRIDEVAKNRVDLFVAFSAAHADYDDFAKLWKKAAGAGVRIRPWLLLSEADGYWFNKWNVQKNAAFAHSFLDEMTKRDVKPDWIIFDVEPPQSLVAKLEDAFTKKHYREALRTLKESARSRSLLQAIEETRSLVNSLHARGVKVHAVTTNFVLNDGKSRRLQNALGTPVTGIPFDEISFMVYRPELAKILGKGVSSKITALYAKRAIRRYGDRAGIDVGEAGFVEFPKPFQGFREPVELQSDLVAVHGQGLRSVHIYSLDGMSELGLEHWLAPVPIPEPPAFDLTATLFVKSISLLRNLLPAAE